jgi:hypothetical protein
MEVSDDKDNDIISYFQSVILEKLLNQGYIDYEANRNLVLKGYNLE